MQIKPINIAPALRHGEFAERPRPKHEPSSSSSQIQMHPIALNWFQTGPRGRLSFRLAPVLVPARLEGEQIHTWHLDSWAGKTQQYVKAVSQSCGLSGKTDETGDVGERWLTQTGFHHAECWELSFFHHSHPTDQASVLFIWSYSTEITRGRTRLRAWMT